MLGFTSKWLSRELWEAIDGADDTSLDYSEQRQEICHKLGRERYFVVEMHSSTN